jgi:MFS family permease
VYAVLFGTISAFLLPALTSIVADVLPPEQVRAGNALGAMTANLTRFVVPPLAGALVAAAGASVACGINAVSFLLAAACLWPIRMPPRSAEADLPPGAIRQSAVAELREGVRAARQDPVVWLTIKLSTVFWFGYSGAAIVGVPALAKLTLDGGDRGVGLLYGASGAGALLGALAAGSRASIRRPGAAACLAVAVSGAALALAGSALALWAAALPLALSGACGSAAAVILLTMVQTRVPDAVRGRVMSLATLGIFGLAPLAYAVAGLAGDVLGPRGLLVAAGGFVAVAGMVGLAQQPMRVAA